MMSMKYYRVLIVTLVATIVLTASFFATFPINETKQHPAIVTLSHTEARSAACTQLASERVDPLEVFGPTDAANMTIRSGTWTIGQASFVVGNPIDWNATSTMNRSEKFHFNAWLPLRGPLANFIATGDRTELRWIVDQILRYADGRFFDNNDYRVHGTRTYVWYDMAVGLRALYLGIIMGPAACDTSITETEFGILWDYAVDHARYLIDEKYFVRATNHGAYQSYGLAVLCGKVSAIPECEIGRALGETRLLGYFNERVKDGILAEHSPAYNLLLAQMLGGIVKNSFVFRSETSEAFRQLYVSMISIIDIFRTPNGLMPQLGDTDSRPIDLEAIYSECAATLGTREGCPGASDARSTTGDKILYHAKQAGYAGFRQPIEGDDSYLMLSAAFHSRVHKHADDLSFVWSDNGFDILVDAGRFAYLNVAVPLTEEQKKAGYYYSDPRRMHVESIHAHNTVEIDSSTPSRRGKPYGAGDTKIFDLQDSVAIYGRVPRADLAGAYHERWLILEPGRNLLILDRISGGQPSTRQYTIWNHFDSTFNQTAFGEGKLTVERPGIIVTAWPVTRYKSAESFRGAEEPRLQGWQSKTQQSLEPSVAFGVTVESADLEALMNFSVNHAVADVRISQVGDKRTIHVSSSGQEPARTYQIDLTDKTVEKVLPD